MNRRLSAEKKTDMKKSGTNVMFSHRFRTCDIKLTVYTEKTGGYTHGLSATCQRAAFGLGLGSNSGSPCPMEPSPKTIVN